MYIDLVMGLNFGVDFLLLLGTNALAGRSLSVPRAALAAALGGLYGGMCLLPGFAFLGNILWRTVILALMAVLAFGFSRSTLSRGILFVLLSMALGGIALGLGDGGIPALLAAAAAVALMCALGFRGRAVGQRFSEIRLCHSGKCCQLTALHDTGNLLKDPITGNSVLVVGADVAWALLGLSSRQLSDPLDTVTRIPGFRLIPYRTVGQPSGMLLAMKMEEMYVDGVRRDMTVAFAPENLCGNGYEALVGGIL